jgi:hypothetical protein
MLQAVATQTVLSGFPVRRAVYGEWALALVLALLFAGALCAPHLVPTLALSAIAVLTYGFAAFALFRETRILLPLAAPAVLLAIGLVVAAILRLRLEPFPR